MKRRIPETKKEQSSPTAPIDEKKCPKCGSRLVKYVRREEIASRGYITTEREIVSYKCEKCKVEVGDDDLEDPLTTKKRLLLSEKGFLTDVDIKRIRKKLGLNQREMAEKLGVGVKTFTRYETLVVRQSRAMDNLLRVLDKYPEAMEVLRVNRGSGEK